MLVHVLLSLAAHAAGVNPDVAGPVAPEVAVARMAACGLGVVFVRFDSQRDADILSAMGAKTLSDRQLACADEAADVYEVELPPMLQPRFDAIRATRAAAAMAATGRQWLKSHRLLDRLPAYRPGVTDDAAFAGTIETLCGAQTALQSRYGAHALNPDWTKDHVITADGPGKAFECLLNAGWASGFEIDFIGNEQTAP